MSAKRVGLKPTDFVHLHNHTQYSLLDGLTKVPQLVDRVKELGMEAVAVTDHGTLSGVIEFYKDAKAGGINPIIGMEAYVAPRDHTDKDPSKDRSAFHLTLLAMNNQGYSNLMQLTTVAHLEGFYYRPRIDRKLLEKFSEGLIVLSGCMGGEVSEALRQGDYAAALETAKWYKRVFGDRYYIELMDHGHANHPSAWDEQQKVNEMLFKLSSELKLPAVVTSDAHYLMHSDKEAHEILLCVQTGAFLADKGRFSLEDFELHVADPKDIIKRWGDDHPDLITNTAAIAKRCKIDIRLGEILIPKYPLPKGENEKTLLDKQVWQGLAWRYGGIERAAALKLSESAARKKVPEMVVKRAEFELKVIDKVGFNGFFLIVNDFVNWGKDAGIVFGPGRGSAAGSIVAFGLRITDIDPIRYDLLFERFLTPDRISMPDLDIDIQDTRRDEVIQYCIDKYGADRVANIVTFGRMAARNSVRDVARVLQVPYADADRLAKMIPPPIQGRHTLLSEHLKNVPELKNEYKSSPQAARVFDLAMKLEGTIRSHGVHAAGVIIAPDRLINYVPLEMAQKGVVATQYSMGPVENIGLLKIDFLGLSNLTIIKNSLRIISRVYGDEIDISQIPLNDQKTYELLSRGETTGVFQLESSGMRRYLKDLKPTVFEDIVAMNALYRPGPLSAGLTDSFIARRNGQEKVKYDHELMRPALENTYGVMVYQEQFMQIVKDMCGFSGSEADTLRQAVGKKKRDLMAKMKELVISGAQKNGVDKGTAEKFWTDLEGFADYAFNKSHAACYGLISYQTAYLKANYPGAFMAALMSSDYDDTDRLAIEITECQNMGIEVLPPDINESFHEFAVIPNEPKIRFGLDAIKNVGHGAVEAILQARQKLGGRFNTLEEFCKTVDIHIANRKTLEALIKAGAFDAFGNRGALVNNIDAILALANRLQKDAKSGQVGLFASDDASMAPSLSLDNSLDVPENEQLNWERELLGVYLSSHPLAEYQDLLTERTVSSRELASALDGATLNVGGLISDLREIVTKSGAKMAFVKLSDMHGEVEAVIFPKTYKNLEESIRRDQVAIVRGRVDTKRGEVKILAEEITIISLQVARGFKPSGVKPTVSSVGVVMEPNRAKLYIRLEDSEDSKRLTALKAKLDAHEGDTEVVIVTGPSEKKQAIKLPQAVDVNESSLRELAAIFGATNVVVR
jgi:DNA polymerase-3 subunit alpha